MQGRPIVFIDVETTGLGAHDGHILEIGAVRVDNGKIVEKYTQLLDPGVDVPWFITNLTGITNQEIAGSPQFAHVADKLDQLFENAIFAAHNVGFDYSFFSSEFRRVGQRLDMDRFCTARLSRALHPEHRRHNLDAVISRGGYQIKNRHRAFDDAYVLYQFYQDSLKADATALHKAVEKIMVRSTIN